ncbi:MAG: MMPL family transporter [Planctomycetaceae bacterium]|nr:MMPL family transporter [Planctomycetaceae bacterium]
MMTRLLVQLVTERRRPAGAVVILATVLALFGQSRLQFDDDPRAFFRRDEAAMEELERLYADFGADDNDVLVVLEAADAFSPEMLSVVRRIVAEAAGAEGIAAVESVLSVRRVGKWLQPLVPASDDTQRYAARRAEAFAHPLVAGHFLSRDGRVMLVLIRLQGESLTVAQIGPRVERLRAIARRATEGSSVRALLSGHPVVRLDVIRNSRREYLRIAGVAAVVSVALAMFFFRRAAAVAVCTAGPAIGVVWVMGILGMAGEPLSGMCIILPTLLFVVGFTGAVHLLVDIRRSLAAGEAPVDTAGNAVKRLFLACLLTSATTAVGLGSLALANNEILVRFGLIAAGGVMVQWLAVLLVVPLLCGGRLGRWLAPRARVTNESRWIRRFVGPAMLRPRLVASLGFAATLASAVAAVGLGSDIHWSEAVPEDSETSQAVRLCDRAFGGALLACVVVQWPPEMDLASPQVLQVVAEVHDLLEQGPATRGALSVADVLECLPGTTAEARAAELERLPEDMVRRLVRTDLRRLAVTAHLPDLGAAALEPGFLRLDRGLAEIETRHEGFRLKLTGTTVVAARSMRGMIADLWRSLITTAVVVFVMIAAELRSMALALAAIVPNAFPLALMAGVLVWTDQPLRVASAMTFSMCLGLAVDDTIHFLTRYRQVRRRGSNIPAAVARTMDDVGPAMIATSVVLIGGFGAMLASPMPLIHLFAWLSCLAIAAALVGDLLFLPAILLSFRRGEAGSSVEKCLDDGFWPARTGVSGRTLRGFPLAKAE